MTIMEKFEHITAKAHQSDGDPSPTHRKLEYPRR